MALCSLDVRTGDRSNAQEEVLGSPGVMIGTCEDPDAVSRVAADILASFARLRHVSLSWLYFGVVWSLIAFGVIVLLLGLDQPLPLIVLSASLNGVVMFLYSGLLLWMNVRSFDPPLRPSPLRMVAMALAFLFFGYFSVLTLLDRLG